MVNRRLIVACDRKGGIDASLFFLRLERWKDISVDFFEYSPGILSQPIKSVHAWIDRNTCRHGKLCCRLASATRDRYASPLSIPVAILSVDPTCLSWRSTIHEILRKPSFIIR